MSVSVAEAPFVTRAENDVSVIDTEEVADRGPMDNVVSRVITDISATSIGTSIGASIPTTNLVPVVSNNYFCVISLSWIQR